MKHKFWVYLELQSHMFRFTSEQKQRKTGSLWYKADFKGRNACEWPSFIPIMLLMSGTHGLIWQFLHSTTTVIKGYTHEKSKNNGAILK